MTKYLSVIPECFVETNMAKVFLHAEVNHQYGCGAVTRIMQNGPMLKDGFAVGLIDDDNMKPKYTDEFDVIATIHVNTNVHYSLLHHANSNHFLFINSPAMERLITESANASNINMSDYGLPNDWKKLKEYTKTLKSDKDIRIRSLITHLSNIVDSPLYKYKMALNYMVSHPYNISHEALLHILA